MVYLDLLLAGERLRVGDLVLDLSSNRRRRGGIGDLVRDRGRRGGDLEIDRGRNLAPELKGLSRELLSLDLDLVKRPYNTKTGHYRLSHPHSSHLPLSMLYLPFPFSSLVRLFGKKRYPRY